MLQRGDSDIGWADLYIIPDRARLQIEKINFHPSGFYRIMVFLHPDSSTTLILTTSSTRASCSRNPLLFLSGRPSQPHFNLQFVFSYLFLCQFFCHILGVACYLTLPCDCQPHLRPPHPTGLEQGTQIWIH